MKKLTAGNLVSLIDKLPKNRAYDYHNAKTKTKIEIVDVRKPEGPILIKRYDTSKGQTVNSVKPVSISMQMLWRVANAFVEQAPVNLDRVLGGSYNTRSALESLILHTSEFYVCHPGRIENIGSQTKIQSGHKHILWLPNKPHSIGAIYEEKTGVVISEVTTQVIYDSLQLPKSIVGHGITIEMQRRHAQIQVALIMIGQQLGFRTWVAHNDKGIVYNGKKIGEMDTVISNLYDEKLLQAYSDGAKAAILIDCIWFKNGKFMPAVIEIEHSTGVTSGLTRMKNFYDHIPPLKNIRWVIVAADEDRKKVLQEASKPQFLDMNVQFMPYSAVEELFSLCERRKIHGITDDFLDCFMEPTLSLLN